jgi:membrane-associated phospholipid phosphatase
MSLLRFLAEYRNAPTSWLMLGISMLGTPFAVIGILAWFYLNVNKTRAALMTLAFYASSLLCQGLKIIFRVPRPWNLDSGFHAVDAAVSTATGYSFPSIHAQSATSLGVSGFLAQKKPKIRFLAVSYIALVCFSRMYLGVHTLTDVLTACLLTSAITVMIFFITGDFQPTRKQVSGFVYFLISFSLVLLFLSSFLAWNGTVDIAGAKDSLENGGAAIGFATGLVLEKKYLHFSTGGSFRVKLIRYLLILSAAIAIALVGHKAYAASIWLPVIRYFFLMLWIMALGPFLMMKLHLFETE